MAGFRLRPCGPLFMNQHDDDLALLLRSFWQPEGSAQQQRQAQQRLYQRLQGKLEALALHVVNYNEELAARAVQEAWIKIFRSASTYDSSKAGVITWAKRITSQCAIDQLRQDYRERWMAPWPDEPPPDTACELPLPDEQADSAALRRVLARCIDELPERDGPNFRLAMQLCLDEDLSHAQMTEILAAQAPPGEQINLERVRGWIRRGKQKLDDCVRARLQPGKKGGNHAG